MAQEKRVKNLMSSVGDCPSVYPEATLGQVLTTIVNSPNVKFALVVERGKIIGAIGAEEVVEAVRPGRVKDTYYRGWNLSSWSVPAYMDVLFTETCKTVSLKKVREIMKPLGQSLKPEDTLSKAVDIFTSNPNGWAPVVDGGQVVGIISYQEIIMEIQAIMAKEKRMKSRTTRGEGAEVVNA
jgi:predicted transcriptional regulator